MRACGGVNEEGSDRGVCEQKKKQKKTKKTHIHYKQHYYNYRD